MVPINVFFFHYDTLRQGVEKKLRPEWYSPDLCLLSLFQVADAKRIRLTIWFDGDESALLRELGYSLGLLETLGVPYRVHTFPYHGALPSYTSWILSITTQPFAEAEWIYILESDYLHVEYWDLELDSLHGEGFYDYVTLYDHPDYYSVPLHLRFITKLHHTKSSIWRTAHSTCFTFLLKSETFAKEYPFIREAIVKGVGDLAFFNTLHLRGKSLISPLPSLSTHSMSRYLAPTRDWEIVAANVENNCKVALATVREK